MPALRFGLKSFQSSRNHLIDWRFKGTGFELIVQALWEGIGGFNGSARPAQNPEIDAMAERIITEIEHINSKELASLDEMIKILHLTNTRRAKVLLEHGEEALTKAERDMGKKVVIQPLLVSTWHTRPYFIIRSPSMGILSACLTLSFVLVFHSITLSLEIPLGIFSFIFFLAMSRLLDVGIVKATRAVVQFLDNQTSLRSFIPGDF